MSGFLWGKPVYVYSTGPIPPTYELRKGDGQVWVDLKWIAYKGSKMRTNYDVDIVRSLVNEFGLTTLQRRGIFSGLVGISPDRLLREVPSHDNPLVYYHSANGIRKRLSSILNVEVEQVGFIGSQAIELGKWEASDLDIVVNLPLSQMRDFESNIWKLKRQAHQLQKEKFGIHFPYKLVLPDDSLGQLEVDIFPKALDPQNHLLAGAKEWLRRSAKQKKRFHVTDTALGAEGWPVLFSDDNIPVIILCNGFKGVFKEGDVVAANSFEVCIDYGDRVLNTWVIDDPFRDIEDAKAYFRFRED